MSCEDVMLYKGCTRGVCMEECVYQKLHALMRVVVSMIAYLDSNFLPILDHFSNNVSTTENHFEHPLHPSPLLRFLPWTTSLSISEVELTTDCLWNVDGWA